MSILKSTNSGTSLIKPSMIDFMTSGFHLSAPTKRYKYMGSDALTLEVEFEDEVSEGRTFVVKHAICAVWKDGVEYRMYITTLKELLLVENYFHLLYYKTTNNEELILEVVRDRIITIAQNQWEEYKKRNFTNWK